MFNLSIFRKLRDKLRTFGSDREGSVAVWFTLFSLPMAGFVGAAVDYTHASSVRTSMQMALDSTALMLSKEASTLTTAQINAKATSFFTAMYNKPEVTNIQITPTYTTDKGSQITVAGTGKVKASFMGILGMSTLTISGTSTVIWGQTRMRVALALDTTGSMNADGKMPALKVAAKALLTQLKAAASKNGDVYVSIVPFSKDVNVGASNYNQPWVDFKDHGSWDGWDNENGSCSKWQYTTKESCQDANKTWTAKNHSTWNGCVTDRDQDYDVKNTAPTTSIQGTLFPAEQYNDCPAELMALSYDWTALNAKIDALYPDGNTNQPIGLQWAWQTLTASPFTIPAKDPNYKYTEVIILMSDGLNTQNRFTNNRAEIDAREKKVCDNIKAAGITVYSVQVNTGGDPLQTVMQNCASDTAKFFAITNANQMVTVFKQIGTQLSQLRISQ